MIRSPGGWPRRRPSAPLAAAVLLLALVAVSPPSPAACGPFVEEHPAWATASLRSGTAFDACVIGEDEYVATVRAWLASRDPATGSLRSLSLGRIVRLPWVSAHLAEAAIVDRAWRETALHGGAGAHNAYVADVLSRPDFLPRLAAPFEGSAFRVTGASVEKVLTGPAGEHATAAPDPAVPVPFDAQLWLTVEGVAGAQ